MQMTKGRTLLVDLTTILLCYSPILISLYATLTILKTLNELILQIVAFPFILQGSFVFAIFVIRLLLPRLKPGVYETNLNKGFIAWYCHSMLIRSSRCFGAQYLLHSTATTRWFHWRALGARVPFNMNTSYKITLHDAAVISSGEGTTLSEDVTLSGHLVRGDKILVAPVKIVQGVFVGRNTFIGPRARIGKSAWIGLGNTLMGDVISEKQVIKSHEWSHGNPNKSKATQISN